MRCARYTTWLTAALIAMSWLGGCATHVKPGGSRSVTSTPSPEIARLRADYSDLIQTGNTESAYPEYVRQMENLLEEWNPVGASVEDVVFLLGRPSERHEDRIVYVFEGGFSGVLWVFQLKHGSVTAAERGSVN